MTRRRPVTTLPSDTLYRDGSSGIEAALSRRERQFMNILFEVGRATGAEVCQRLPDSPTYSSVRTILRILEGKGQVRYFEVGTQCVDIPALEREVAGKAATQRLITGHFTGSTNAALAVLLDLAPAELSDEDHKELERVIYRETTSESKCPAGETLR